MIFYDSKRLSSVFSNLLEMSFLRKFIVNSQWQTRSKLPLLLSALTGIMRYHEVGVGLVDCRYCDQGEACHRKLAL
jgi:hypothetical protein